MSEQLFGLVYGLRGGRFERRQRVDGVGGQRGKMLPRPTFHHPPAVVGQRRQQPGAVRVEAAGADVHVIAVVAGWHPSGDPSEHFSAGRFRCSWPCRRRRRSTSAG
jgi:hypothetical protein